MNDLVSTQWLAEHLDDEGLRILEATVILQRHEDGTLNYSSGLDGFEREHIPGAQFVDLITELSDPSSDLGFTLPREQRVSEVLSRLGVNNDSNVVVYSAADGAWAARVWWLLRAFGAKNVAVLDGGLGKWKREGLPVSNVAGKFPPARFIASLNREMIVDKTAMGKVQRGECGCACVIDTMSPEHYRGELCIYSRPGHIPGAINIPNSAVKDPATGEFLPPERLVPPPSNARNI